MGDSTKCHGIGFPDINAVSPKGDIIYLELKLDYTYPTAEQIVWIDRLNKKNLNTARILRPKDFAEWKKEIKLTN